MSAVHRTPRVVQAMSDLSRATRSRVLTSATILLALLAASCSGPITPTPTHTVPPGTPAPAPTPAPSLRVEPTARQSFGLDSSLPAGTTFHLSVSAMVPDATISVNRCGEPCFTANVVAYWYPNDYVAGDELRTTIGLAGVYYLWVRDERDGDSSTIVTDQVVGGRLRMTFENGMVLEAWYSLP